MVHIKTEEISDGNFAPWDAALGSIEEFGGVLLETPMGKRFVIRSEDELKKYFNFD